MAILVALFTQSLLTPQGTSKTLYYLSTRRGICFCMVVHKIHPFSPNLNRRLKHTTEIENGVEFEIATYLN